jgi:toxin-antitoxin system PIN domain toxin
VKLLDANVWVAAAWVHHVHHDVARFWLDQEFDDLAWCRATQSAFLRLVCQRTILGLDALTRRAAWTKYDALAADPRVRFLEEPDGLETVWRAFSLRDDRAHQVWTDDYLAAFAQASAATLVTFDRAARSRYPSVSVSVLR